MVPGDPFSVVLYRGFQLLPTDSPMPTNVASVVYQVRTANDDSVYTDWEDIGNATSFTNYAIIHDNLVPTLYYEYRLKYVFGTGLESDWSDYITAGLGPQLIDASQVPTATPANSAGGDLQGNYPNPTLRRPLDNLLMLNGASQFFANRFSIASTTVTIDALTGVGSFNIEHGLSGFPGVVMATTRLSSPSGFVAVVSIFGWDISNVAGTVNTHEHKTDGVTQTVVVDLFMVG